MSRLGLYLVGPPRVELDGEPVHIGRSKAVALLAYLAIERRRHSRDALAALLWPDFDQRGARAELRRVLSVLNRSLETGWLVTDGETVGLDPDADPSTGSGQVLWLDVEQFRQRLTACEAHGHPAAEACPDCLTLLTEAVELCRDDFMSGFTLPDSPAFDDWQRYQTQGLRDELASAMERLADCHSAQGNFEEAIACARRGLELDPTHEPAHRHLMALYAQAGRRAAALRQYRECVRVLEQELGLPPAAETTALYEQLRAPGAGTVRAKVTAPTPTLTSTPAPAFLREDAQPATVERPVFVARERELAQLSRHLDAALAGQGRVVFISGDPGRGKTTLMGEFARRTMAAHSDLLVASGVCNAYTGVGDPYLPFREVLGMLTGDVEGDWDAGRITHDHAQRLWAAIPLASRALLDHGPHLIDTLLPGPALLARARTFAHAGDGWLDELRAWVEREKGLHAGLEQSALFTQLANVLTALSATHPLLLLLDDLQWADVSSVSLLFHLGRRLPSARILIVGAYRPEEVAAIQPREPHPLQEMLAEFQRHFGNVTLDLTQSDTAEGRRFVDLLLDAEPNRLSAEFHATFHRHTGGHPLFTIELLQAMQERGDLVRNEEGLWIESEALDWAALPARVEAVIEKRMERLDQSLRDLLTVASVEGERFTAQVVAQVEGVSERQVLRALSSDLGPGGHRLVWEMEEIQTAETGRFLSRFRFAHALFQEYLYHRLSAGERRLLHGEVGTALEALYGARVEQVAIELVHHFDHAGRWEKAIPYALQAGDQSRLSYANEAAIAHYRRGLGLLDTTQSYPPTDNERQWRLTVLKGLGEVHYGTGRIEEAEGRFREAIALGRGMGLAPRELARLHWWLGEVLFWKGEYGAVTSNAEEGLALLDDQATQSAEAALMYGHLIAVDGVLRIDPDRNSELAQRMANIILRVPYSPDLRPAYNLVAGVLATVDKDVEGALSWMQALEERAAPVHDWRALGEIQFRKGMISLDSGNLQAAVSFFQQALEIYEKIGDAKLRGWCLFWLAMTFTRSGDLRKAEAFGSRSLDAARALESERDLARGYEWSGIIHQCLHRFEEAEHALQRALQIYQEIDLRLSVTLSVVRLGRLFLARGERDRATTCFQKAMGSVQPDAILMLTDALSGLQEACGDEASFRAFCRRLRKQNPEVEGGVLQQWYLEPVAAGRHPETPHLHSGFTDFLASDGTRSAGWLWQDPLGDCSYGVLDGLEIHAANGRDLWHINLSAPRLLRSAPDDDFAVQALCVPAAADRPSIGGLLLWHDKENYLRLDRGTRGPCEISFQGCIGNKDLVIGRGQLQMGKSANGQMDKSAKQQNGSSSGRVFLRLERIGERVDALCSADGESWFTVGHVDFPVEGRLQVGLHAIGMIDRTIYHGAYPDGTAIRFESFQMWGS